MGRNIDSFDSGAGEQGRQFSDIAENKRKLKLFGNLGAGLLREPQVVLQERVLGADAAADHAGAATRATGARDATRAIQRPRGSRIDASY